MKALQEGRSSTLLTSPRYRGTVLAESVMIQWEGRPACMITYRSLPDAINSV